MNKGLSADDVIAVSRGVGVNPPMALQELGHLTLDEMYGFLDSDGTLLADADLPQVIMQAARVGLTRDQLVQLGLEANAAADDLAARRRSNTSTPNVHSRPYAADSSDTEPEPGDDDYHDGP